MLRLPDGSFISGTQIDPTGIAAQTDLKAVGHLYRFTIEDPALYDRPWLAEVVLHRSNDRLYEYACHEGNYAIEHILLAARLGKQKPLPEDKDGDKDKKDTKASDAKTAGKKPKAAKTAKSKTAAKVSAAGAPASAPPKPVDFSFKATMRSPIQLFRWAHVPSRPIVGKVTYVVSAMSWNGWQPSPKINAVPWPIAAPPALSTRLSPPSRCRRLREEGH